MNKALILKELQIYYKLPKDGDFAEFLGIKQNTLSSWRSRNSIDYDKIIAKCHEIDANWLLTGAGQMLKITSQSPDDEKNYKDLAESRAEIIELLKEKIVSLNNTIDNLKAPSVQRGSVGLVNEPSLEQFSGK